MALMTTYMVVVHSNSYFTQ